MLLVKIAVILGPVIMTFGFLDVHLSTDYIIIGDYSQSVALEPEQDVEHMDHI